MDSQKRSTKFTQQEEETLFKLISSNLKIIENNSTDVQTQQKRKDTWDEIVKKFNETTPRARSAQSLKDKFFKTRRRLRSENAHKAANREEDDGFVDEHFSTTEESKRDAMDAAPSGSEGLKQKKEPRGREKRRTYSKKEEEFLVHLVSLHTDFPDDRKNDGSARSRMKTDWEKITKEFNTLSPALRSEQSLREKWCKLKASGRAKPRRVELNNSATAMETATDSESEEDDVLNVSGTQPSNDSHIHWEDLENLTPEEEFRKIRLQLLQEKLAGLKAKRELYRLQILEKKRDMEMKEELHRARLQSAVEED